MKSVTSLVLKKGKTLLQSSFFYEKRRLIKTNLVYQSGLDCSNRFSFVLNRQTGSDTSSSVLFRPIVKNSWVTFQKRFSYFTSQITIKSDLSAQFLKENVD